MRLCTLVLITALALAAVSAAGQTFTPPHSTRKAARPHAVHAVTGQKYHARKKFVLDVIDSAVSLPQPDSQDRLRVLLSAARLARNVSPPLARSLAGEGASIEMQLVGSGTKPAVSLIESGLVDCGTATNFVDSLTSESIGRAADSLARVAAMCGRQALPSIQRKLEDALQNGAVPPRAMLAAMQAAGARSGWSQQQFDSVFSSLPDPQRSRADAPLLASLYDFVAPVADRQTARSAGIKFLEWLAKLEPSAERTQSATLATATMKKVLGEERYGEVLRSSITAAQVAQLAGQPFEVSPPEEEPNVSVLKAMSSRRDATDELQQLAPAQRARQAAAYGFSAGKSGDRSSADRFFDTAFAAASEAWEHRFPGQNAVAVLEEVSEAAAHVDPVAALGRAQALPESAARAISMLAVAQVVLSRQDLSHPPARVASAGAH